MQKQVKRLIIFAPLLFVTALVPLIASAQTATDVLSTVSDFLGNVLPVLVSIGVIYFIWGVVQYVIAGGEEAKKKGKDQVIYGIIGLAVVISVWGLVYVLASTFGLGGESAPNVSELVSTPTAGLSCPSLNNTSKLPDYLNYVTCVIGRSVVPLIFALAVVFFVWGAVSFFIINADEEAKRAQGKQFMIWGIIALTVMVSVWGLVGILASTFGLDSASFIPQVKSSGPSSGGVDPCANYTGTPYRNQCEH